MDAPATKIASDPSSPQVLGDDHRSTGAAEEFGCQVPRLRRRLLYASKHLLWFLGREAYFLGTIGRLKHGDAPEIVHKPLVDLLINDRSIGPLNVHDPALLFIPT